MMIRLISRNKVGDKMLAETDKIIYRKIQLLKLLEKSSDSLTIGEINTKMGLSLKTTQKELDSLKEDLTNFKYGIEMNTLGKFISFKKKNSFNMDLVYLTFKKKSTYFYLIKKSIVHNDMRIENESNYVYSSSKLYKDRKIFKNYLKKFHLELESGTQEIIGNEVNIRFLYFQFFWGNYRGVEWPFDSVLREEFIRDINFYDSHLVKAMSEIQKEQFLYWLVIFKMREKKNKLIEDERFILDQNFSESSEEIKKLLSKISNIKEESLCIEANYLYFIFTLTAEFSEYKKGLLENLGKDTKYFPIQKIVFKLVSQFKQKFSIDDTKVYETIYFSIYKVFLLEIIYKGNFRESDFVAMPEIHIPKKYKSEFFLFYSEIMMQYGEEYSKNNYLLSKSSLFFSFLINFKSYQPEISVKLLSSSGDFFEYVVKNKIKSLVNNIVIEYADAKDVDLVVSDCVISTDEKGPIFYWSIQPTENEWNELKTTLKVIEQSKNVS